jgi:DNA-binding IclR family transcriptional regulator/sugar lactone lactonase YvrE
MPTPPTEGTASLDKALDVLDAVGTAPAGLSQAELADRLALPRTTAYRLLGTLVARGLLRRDAQRKVYVLGLRCFEYARAAYAMPDLVAAASAELRALRDMTGETTYLATRDGLDVVSLERVDGAHSQRSHSALGQRKPLHCTSQGKAILAALPAAQRDALVRELTLTAVTPHSITDRRHLQAELRTTAARGFSIDEEEIVPGVRCCGAAIVDSSGTVRGAISVAGPAFRLTRERIELLGPELAEAARRIGAQLSATQGPRSQGDAVAVAGEWAFEGAFAHWSVAHGLLFWADTLAPAVHAATVGGDRLLARTEAPIQALLPHPLGALVASGGQWWLAQADGSLQPAPGGAAGPAHPADGTAGAWPTALCTGPGGALWACLPQGAGWRVGPCSPGAWPVTGAAPGLAGTGWPLPAPATALAWAADGRKLFIATADTGTLWVAAADGGALRRLATVPQGSGRLAGLAPDTGGGVWCALHGGWSVAHFDASGALDQVLALPVPCPTSVALGGADGHTLFVTSARNTLKRDALDTAPLSGRLFVLRTSTQAR